MTCMSCDGTGYVTVETPCKDPDNCNEGGPLNGKHEIDIVCPCCGDESDDDDEGEEEDEDED